MIAPRIAQAASELAAQWHPEADESVHFTESLVRLVLEELTTPGDRVLDPFAGFGTTLVVSERLGRPALGIELLPERVELIRGRGATVFLGDARDLLELVEGPFALCLSSPPYRGRIDHPEDPLDGYRTVAGDYDGYLSELLEILRSVSAVLAPGGHLVINAANLVTYDLVTPLADDLTVGLLDTYELVSVSELVWDEVPEWMVSDRLIVLRVPSQS